MFPEYFSDEHYSLYPCPDAIGCCMTNLTSIAIFYKIHMILKGKTPEFIRHIGKNMNEYYIISGLITLQMNTFMIVFGGEKFPSSKINYPVLFSFMILFCCRILIDINDKYINFGITTLKNPTRYYVFFFIWIITIINVIYIYPKVEIYATFWNNYLRSE